MTWVCWSYNPQRDDAYTCMMRNLLLCSINMLHNATFCDSFSVNNLPIILIIAVFSGIYIGRWNLQQNGRLHFNFASYVGFIAMVLSKVYNGLSSSSAPGNLCINIIFISHFLWITFVFDAWMESVTDAPSCRYAISVFINYTNGSTNITYHPLLWSVYIWVRLGAA
jgi:hypothetical protein